MGKQRRTSPPDRRFDYFSTLRVRLTECCSVWLVPVTTRPYVVVPGVPSRGAIHPEWHPPIRTIPRHSIASASDANEQRADRRFRRINGSAAAVATNSPNSVGAAGFEVNRCDVLVPVDEELEVRTTRLTVVIGLPAGTVEGERVMLDPGGRPDTESVTALNNCADPTGAMVSLYAAVAPAVVEELGEPTTAGLKSATPSVTNALAVV